MIPCVYVNESVGFIQGETFVLCGLVGLLACLIDFLFACLFACLNVCLHVGLLTYLLLCYLHSQL
jgi:hypothetical protein